MRRFVFGMERLLDLRAHREEDAKIALGSAVQALAAVERSMAALAEERARAAAGQFAPDNRAEDFVYYARYLQRLDAQAERLSREAAAAELAVEQARERFLEASRERKVLDALKDKRKAAYKAAARKEEQKQIDEIAGSAPARAGVRG
ncbi:MAG: flagellar export protein FliJ [Treponema sp.]|nr:flagellar export protein FliJ [Treponema sp.]